VSFDKQRDCNLIKQTLPTMKLAMPLANGSINSSAIAYRFLTFAILCATKYKASTATFFC
jgi:hypothetical protein